MSEFPPNPPPDRRPLSVAVSRILVIAVVAVILALVGGLGIIMQTRSQARQNADLLKVIVDCNTPGDSHSCYQDVLDRRSSNLAEIRRSIDCVITLSAHLNPPQCEDVRGRIVAMAGGVDPFTTPPTTRSNP